MDEVKQTTAPPRAPNFRCSFSLPQQLARDLSTVAKAMGVSQSALLALLLEQPLSMLAKVVALAPPGGADVDPVATRRLLKIAMEVDPGLPL